MRATAAWGLLPLAVLASACAATETAGAVHTETHVGAAFAEAGLPLARLPLDDPGALVVNPSGGTLPRTVLHPRAEEGFGVYVWGDPEQAGELVASAPETDPVTGQRRVFLRNGNVVVVVQPPDEELIARLEPIVASL